MFKYLEVLLKNVKVSGLNGFLSSKNYALVDVYIHNLFCHHRLG